MAEKAKPVFQNLIDYVEWRGDLSFDSSEFNNVDALIFCQLSYLHLDSLVSSEFDDFISLKDMAQKFKNSPDFEKRKDLGMMINPKTTSLLFKCAQSARFGEVLISGFAEDCSTTREEQFAALTFCFDFKKSRFSEKTKKAFVAFRGTDDTLIGWKEDFNLAFMESVPAQNDAANYLRSAINSKTFRKCDFYAGGHSKGGNLAVFAGAKQDKKSKEKIIKIFNFDGPGFSEKDLSSADFCSVKQKIISVFPQMSLIGMLFHHYEGYKVVESSEKLIMQHDPFSWNVRGCDFAEKDSLESGSEIFFKSFNKWFENLEKVQRENFVETVFGLLESTKASTNTELSRNFIKNAGTILKAAVKLDSSIRDDALKIISQFLKITGNEIKDSIFEK